MEREMEWEISDGWVLDGLNMVPQTLLRMVGTGVSRGSFERKEEGKKQDQIKLGGQDAVGSVHVSNESEAAMAEPPTTHSPTHGLPGCCTTKEPHAAHSVDWPL